MSFTLNLFVVTLGLFAGMLLLLEWGRRLGQRRILRDGEKASEGDGAVNGAIFALMGLLIAFTFSGAASRLDLRRNLIVEEANAIGTAYLRLDLLSPEAREPLKEQFRRYADARLEIYRHWEVKVAISVNMAKSIQLQNEIWRSTIAACRAETGQSACMLLLPALNDMIDITSTRSVASVTHPPSIIFAMLFLFTLAGSVLAGFGMAGNKTRNWTHMLAFAATLSFAVYVTLDLEFPRLGLIRLDDYDQVLVDVRASMN